MRIWNFLKPNPWPDFSKHPRLDPTPCFLFSVRSKILNPIIFVESSNVKRVINRKQKNYLLFNFVRFLLYSSTKLNCILIGLKMCNLNVLCFLRLATFLFFVQVISLRSWRTRMSRVGARGGRMAGSDSIRPTMSSRFERAPPPSVPRLRARTGNTVWSHVNGPCRRRFHWVKTNREHFDMVE